MSSPIWRNQRRLKFILLISSCLALTLIAYKATRSSGNVNYKNFVKPNFTNLDELNQRKKNGSLDNIPLSNLLKFTRIIHKPKSLCTYNTEMVIFVQSACKHRDLRDAVRRTWGKEALYLNIPVWFFLGLCPSSEKERSEHKDIVEVDFVDSYYNNTLKSLSRFRMFNEECSHLKYLIMSDDDVIVNIEDLFRFLEQGIGYSVVGGYYSSGTYVIRNKDSKWYVPTWVWPAKYYPEYIAGGFYVVNGSAALDIYEASLNINYLSIDDVVFTGLAGDMIGINRISDWRFPVRRYSSKFHCAQSWIFSSDWNATEIYDYWKRKLSCKQ